jgi:hypothetical protein
MTEQQTDGVDPSKKKDKESWPATALLAVRSKERSELRYRVSLMFDSVSTWPGIAGDDVIAIADVCYAAGIAEGKILANKEAYDE